MVSEDNIEKALREREQDLESINNDSDLEFKESDERKIIW